MMTGSDKKNGKKLRITVAMTSPGRKTLTTVFTSISSARMSDESEATYHEEKRSVLYIAPLTIKILAVVSDDCY